MGKKEERSHFFPTYNLRYWKKNGSKLYNKTKNEDRKFNPKKIFWLHKFYYFDNIANLEMRLSNIECHMAKIIKSISSSVNYNNIKLSEYQVNFIQLFLFLQAYRQLSTTEVIKDDESGLYKSNDYIFGVFNIKTYDQMKLRIPSLVIALESFIKEKHSKKLAHWMRIVLNTHLVIAKNNDSQICQSDVCCIISNDVNSNHLYTYFPQTPNLAFFLVNTKYFFPKEKISNYLAKNCNKYHCSILLDQSKKLVCEYDKLEFVEQTEADFFLDKPNTNFQELKDREILLNFIEIPNNIIDSYNKILFEDGKEFIHPQEKSYISYLESLSESYRIVKDFTACNCRLENLSINPIDVITANLLITKKGTNERIKLKQELNSWINGLIKCQNKFKQESLFLGSTNQKNEPNKLEVISTLPKKELLILRRFIKNFEEEENETDNTRSNQKLVPTNQFENNSDEVLDLDKLQPSTSGLTRGKLQKNIFKTFKETELE